jgi:outer membrane lipoprotein carrier protein
VPRLDDTDFREVRLGFRGDQLERMELSDRLGQLTRIRFSAIEMNPKLPADLFRFRVPAGVDVVGTAATR